MGLMMAARRYTLEIPIPLNVDEAQWTASARTILTDPIVWRSSDLTTSGPLNGLAIAWPTIFGTVPSLYTSRLTAIWLQIVTLALVAAASRAADRFGPASAACAIAAAFLAYTGNKNFLHYSSEILSGFLIAAFCLLYLRLTKTRHEKWMLPLCGFIATALPFAKLQSSLFCLLFHFLLVYYVYFAWKAGRLGRKDLALYVACSALPVIILVLPLYLVGEEQAFLTGYLKLGAGYANARSLRLFAEFLPYILVMAGLMGIALIQAALARRPGALRWDCLVLGLALWPVAAITVWLPGRNFPHYVYYLIIAMPLGIAVARRATPPLHGPAGIISDMVSAGAAAICIAAILHDVAPYRKPLRAEAAADARFRQDGAEAGARRLFAWADSSAGDTMLMWGWMPELTVYSGLMPAGRESHGEYLIRPNNGRDYFRQRLLRDLAGKAPALVIDAIRPDYFFTNDPGFKAERSTLASFPALLGFVQDGYDGVATRSVCAGVYLRRDKARAWRAAEIALQSDVPALVDNSVTERCQDWWAPPDGAEASAHFTLARPEPLREVWILSSRGGQARDRGTTTVAVSFIDAAGAATRQTVPLFDYPRWTVIRNSSMPAITRIVVTTMSHVGAGAALNEVKAFRIAGAGATR